MNSLTVNQWVVSSSLTPGAANHKGSRAIGTPCQFRRYTTFSTTCLGDGTLVGVRGSKTQRQPGVWTLRAYVGRVDGVDKQKAMTFKGSARGADKALRAFVADVEQGKHDPRPSPGTVADVLARWIEGRSRDWAPRTLDENRKFVTRYLIERVGSLEAEKVRPRDLDQLYRTLADEVGIPTARRAHVHLHAAFREAVRSDLLARNPAERARPPKAAAKAEREVRIEDAVKVMQAAASHDPPDWAMATLVRVAIATGARRGELGALRWKDIDLKAGRITFRHALSAVDGGVIVKGTKTGAVKVVAVDAGTVKALKAWRAESDRGFSLLGETIAPTWFVWGGREPWHPDGITQRWQRCCKLAGVTMRLHDVRHASGSLMVAAGIGPAEAAKRLGHSAEVLLSTYSHALPESDRAMADLHGAAIDAALAPDAQQPPTEVGD